MEPVEWILLISAIVSALGAGANVISSANTNASNERNVDKTNELNRQLQSETNALSVQEANRNRSYYSPQNLMQMYKSAGLNSNLMASTGASSVGAGSSIPTLGTAKMQPFQKSSLDYGSVVNSPVDNALKVAQTNNLMHDSKLKDSQIQLNESSKLNIAADVKLKGEQMQQIRANCLKLSAEIDKVRAEIGKLDVEKQGLLIDNLWKDKRYTSEIANLTAQTKKALSEVALNNSKIDLNKVDYEYLTKTLAARVYGVTLQNKFINSEVKLNTELAANELERRSGIILDNGNRGIDFMLNQSTLYYIQSMDSHWLGALWRMMGFITDNGPSLPIRFGVSSSSVTTHKQ